VSLVVSKDQKTLSTFLVHESHLFNLSPVFKAAFEKQWKESSERSMTLPDDDVDIVEAFVDFLYKERFEHAVCNNKTSTDGVVNLATRLYIFADKYSIIKMQNSICQTIIALATRKSSPPCSAITHLYSNAPETNGLYRLFIDWLAWQTDKAWFRKEDNRTCLAKCGNMAADLIIALAERVALRRPECTDNPIVSGEFARYFIKEA